MGRLGKGLADGFDVGSAVVSVDEHRSLLPFPLCEDVEEAPEKKDICNAF